MKKADEELLEQLLPKGRKRMFQSLRDAGVRGASPITNVRWINLSDDGVPVLYLWRKDIQSFEKGRPVARIVPRTWDVESSSIREDKRDEVIEKLSASDGSYIRAVILEQKPGQARKHGGTRFDSNARWRVRQDGDTFRLYRSKPGEVEVESPPVSFAETGTLKPSRREVRSQRIERSAEVRRRTLERAKYRCENPRCTDQRHYASVDVHHVTFLGRRGADHTRNTVALCPSCHTRVHRGNPQVRSKFDKLLKDILKRRRKG